MNCWFCESAIAWGDHGPYCPFADCPALKDSAGPLHRHETDLWRSMREAGTLWLARISAGFLDDDDDDWPDDVYIDPLRPAPCSVPA